MTAVDVVWQDRIYSPLVTLWVFLGQVLSADHSCRAAVARLIAHRVSRGQSPCSGGDGCLLPGQKAIARKVFPDRGLLGGTRVGRQGRSPVAVERSAGLHVRRHDGHHAGHARKSTSLSASLQSEARPRLSDRADRSHQSLSCGAIINLGFCRYAGKGQGEVSLLRRLWDVLRPGDVLLADRLMANWTNILLLQERGVELVSRLNKANRKADFRRGKRLGDDDHIVRWFKPTSIRSLDRKTYKRCPSTSRFEKQGFGSRSLDSGRRSIVVVTTLLDPQQTTKEDLATLYRARWNNELDLRSIKSTMQMGELAMQDAGTGAQGDLDACPGLQSHPHDHGPGRGTT